MVEIVDTPRRSTSGAADDTSKDQERRESHGEWDYEWDEAIWNATERDPCMGVRWMEKWEWIDRVRTRRTSQQPGEPCLRWDRQP